MKRLSSMDSRASFMVSAISSADTSKRRWVYR
ncbi:Uncharacterised protein [Mycobacteroides abscessus subsp. abscessus]|nr:Uncharacterised protein [Mycobacteroides abscessus subsp. abscessus]